MGTVAGEQYKRKKVKENTEKDGEVRWTSDRQHGSIKKKKGGRRERERKDERNRQGDLMETHCCHQG